MTGDFVVGDWLVQPSLGRMSRGAQTVSLRAKVMDLLVFFASRPGQVVSKNDLLDGVWGTDAISESALTVTIAELRQALGDNADKPRVLETISKRGYRLIADVRPVSNAAIPAAKVTPASRRWWLAAAAIAIVSVGVWIATAMTRSGEVSQLSTRRVTTLDGVEGDPALSPDGSQVAFIWKDALYVKTIEGGELQLVIDDVTDSAAWSPDGQWIAVIRGTRPNEYDLLLVPALGGSERRIGGFRAGHWRSVSWSPDGQELAIVHSEMPGAPTTVLAVSPRTGTSRRLGSPVRRANATNDTLPAFSNDGRSLVFIRNFGQTFEIVRVPAAGGAEAALGPFDGQPTDVDWAPGDLDLIVSMRTADSLSALWRVPLGGGRPVQLQAGENATRFAIRNSRLAYAQLTSDNELRLMPADPADVPSRPLLRQGRDDSLPRFSPDGGRVAFVSGRTNSAQVWVCGSDGASCTQITHQGHSFDPVWSPDGSAIAYTAEGNDIYVVDARGGAARPLTDHPAFDIGAGWSGDGRFVYFNSLRSGEWRMWRAPLSGGAAVDAAFGGGHSLRESSDGWFYFYRPREQSIVRTHADGKASHIFVTDVPRYSQWTLWNGNVVLVRKGDVVYRVDDAGKLHEFKQLRHSGPVEELRTGCQDFDVAPNGDVVFCVGRAQGDIVLIENLK